MYTNFFLAKDIYMKKSTKILLIIFIIVFVASCIMGRYIFEGINPTENGFEFNFDAKGIIAIVITAVSVILGNILYFRFLMNLPIDKMLFFATAPLMITYGVLIFLVADLAYLQGKTAQSFQTLLNVSVDNTYNTILWAVLVSLAFITMLFILYLIICRPVTRVERLVLRLGDGKVSQPRLVVGGGKQFSAIEHGLNKINNNYKEKDNTLKEVDLQGKKFVPKQFLKFLGKSNLQQLELGNQVKKAGVCACIKLIGLGENESLSLEENFNLVNSYLNIISPYIRKFGGFIDKYSGDSIVAVFANSEDALNCSQQIVKAISSRNIAKKNMPDILPRISIIKGEIIFGIVGDEENKIPAIVSPIVDNLDKIDKVCALAGSLVIFTKNCIDDFPLDNRFHYRYIGSVTLKESKTLEIYELTDTFPRQLQERYRKTKAMFENGVYAYNEGRYEDAKEVFGEILKILPDDKASYLYYNKADEKLNN